MNLMIERAFIMALLLSISGFIFCAIYLPFEKLAYKLTSAKTMVFVNTLALFSFITPLYFAVSIRDGSESAFTRSDMLIYQDVGGYEGFVCNVRSHIHLEEYLGVIWLIGAVFFLIYYVWRYVRLIYFARKSMFRINDDLWYEKFSAMKDDKKAANVRLVGSCNISTLCTIGVKNRFIVIPSYIINSFDEEEVGFILEHEFYHVMHQDLLRRLLMLILNCLNWFNPLYYFLRNNLSEWIEAACDEEVTKNFTKTQRRKYCQLMIKALELEESRTKCEILSVSFAGLDLKNYKRRMTKIMKKNGTGGMLGKVTVATVAMMSMFCGNAVAKEADVPVNMMFSKNVEIVETGEFEEVDDSEIMDNLDFQTDSFANMSEFVPCDTNDTTYEIIYNGKVTFVSDLGQGQIEPKHVHNIVDITLKEHKKNSNGSCKTTYYEGKKCTVCGTTWKGDVIKTVTEDPCMH